ncbi:hypothetical protein GCM10023189_19490 [Nibrella saemangeumensis]|uniref:Uncharacterized protein n=1 Tax=Nibrella saemangeumensis TaxID=1084526 RepID=A0ABP8MPG4_9BACT
MTRLIKTATTLLVVAMLNGCTADKNLGSLFETERQYRHALPNGSFETIQFKSNGQVYANMLVNGETVEANGRYQIRREHYVDVVLSRGPYRKIHFLKPVEGELRESKRGFRWKKAGDS